MTDTGFTQINDIVLSIPPESIQINRRSFNHEWQTLRTRSSMKVKSGFSQLDITMTVKFTDDPLGTQAGKIFNGYDKLRNLISQFRVTPFCFVENQFLRNSILAGTTGQNMALAMKQIEISKTDETTNTITAVFNFCWFNYSPFAKNFTFKRDIFVGDEVTNPTESNAWRLMYSAEQARTGYKRVNRLVTSTSLTHNEFSQLHVVDYSKLKKEVDTLNKVKQDLIRRGGTDEVGATADRVKEIISQELKNEEWTNSLLRETFGDQTSMYGSNEIDGPTEQQVKREILRVIDTNITPGGKFDLIVNTEWTPVTLNDSETVSFKNEPGKEEDDKKFDKSTTVLLRRKRGINLEGSGITTTGITISFENILATLPMIGHPYPTFQHIGSIDARVVISMVATTESAIKKLSELYSSLEDQSRKYRLVPAGQRNLIVDNDLVNMCGVKDTIPESLIIETVPGSPGTYSAVLVLSENPLDASTRETINSEGGFTSSSEIRLKIAQILESNLRLIDDAFITQDNKVSLRGLKPPTAVFAEKESRLSTGDLSTPRTITKFEGGESSYYTYTGSRNERKELFRSLVEDYGKGLSGLLEKMFPIIQKAKETPHKVNFRPEDFFQLKDQDVFSIEKLQGDLVGVLAKIKFDPSAVLESNGSLLANIQSGRVGEVQKSVSDYQAQADRTEAAFKIYNQILDSRTSKDYTSESAKKVLDEGEKNFAAFADDQRITVLINEYLIDWVQKAVNILDGILNSGYIDLPEFEEVKKVIAENGLKSKVSCYPDFPLNDVVNLIQSAPGANLKQAFKRLQDLYSKNDASIKNYGLSSLINPDFYFYNPQNDVLDSIIPNEVINTAGRAIKDAREDMVAAEKDWFLGAYRSSILGQSKATRSDSDIMASLSLPSFKGILKTSAGKSYSSSLQNSVQETGLAPNLLTGTVGPSLTEAAGIESLPQEGEAPRANPVVIPVRNSGNDKNNTRLNYNQSITMLPIPGAESVRHRFDTEDCMDSLPEVAYQPKTNDPNQMPFLKWPIDGHKMTSPFNPNRMHPVLKIVRPHNGVDLVPGGGQKTAGTQVRAAADGVIVGASYSTRIGCVVFIRHSGGMQTRYLHMALDDTTQEWINLIKREGNVIVGGVSVPVKTLPDKKREELLTVPQDFPIGVLGEGFAEITGPHLHFEVYIGGSPVDPIPYLDGSIYASKGPVKGIEPQNDSLLSKSVEQFQKDLYKGQGYSMMRAYPTFKLFFIESDAGERKTHHFDDFFSYSSIKEIQVIRSRKIAADLCIIELTNISGVLSNRKFFSALDPTKAKDAGGQDANEKLNSPQRTNTVHENPIASLMLQPGIQIQLNLGYSNNPEDLETVFNGTITDVQFTDTDDLVQITCQSFATELVQTVQGEVKGFGGFADGDGRTYKILEELLSFPEVVHFGRWEMNGIGINNNRGLLTNRWRLIPTPQDDNIFAPTGNSSLGIFDAFVSTTKYQMYQTTIWDVFQEMCLRHPSYIASAVPYKGKMGPRMTMFFGLPDQLYFARDSSAREDSNVAALKKTVETGFETDKSDRALQDIRDNSIELDADILQEVLEDDLSKKTSSERDRFFQLLSKQYALDKGYIKPFRNYHLLTSSMHILYNSISSSSHNCFNTVTLQYGDKAAEFDEDTAQLNFDNLETFTLKSDETIPDEEVRELFAQYPNCVGYEMAKQYSVSLLFNSLKEAYKGSIVTIGLPKIKPYDVCYVFDEYTDMYGPVEVEQVVHRFSQQTGFITEITPDLMVHVNQHATLSTNDAMGLIAEHAIRSIGIESAPAVLKANGLVTGLLTGTALANIAFSPIAAMTINSSENAIGQNGESSLFGLVGTFIFRKLITRTQLAHPFRFSPLVLNSKPMTGGLPNRRSDGTFIQQVGKWFKDAKEGIPLVIDETMDRMNPNNWIGDLGEGDIKTLLPGG